MRKFLTKIALVAGFGLALAFTFSCSTSDDDSSGSKSVYYGWYGDGSATNYTISTAEQLRGLANIVRGRVKDTIPQDDFRGKTITLDADLDLSSQKWLSIGNPYSNSFERGASFNGTFDGNNKTISGILTDNIGVFGHIGEYGTVKNIIFTDFKLEGSDGVGGLARNNEGTIQNISISGNINGSAGGGGLVDYNSKSGIVENSYFYGNITNTGLNTGSIVGNNSGIVQNCYSAGDVTISGSGTVGGVVGNNSGTVQNCYSTTNISGSTSTIGGVVGYNKGIVQDCYSTGRVNGAASGGVVGSNDGGTIQNCYTTSSVISTRSSVGGVTGGCGKNSIRNSVALNSSISPKDNSGINSNRICPNNEQINNYGLSGIVINGYTIVSNVNGPDGADITSAEWNDVSWWQNTVGFSPSVWEFRENGLPILKNMPAGTQNPIVNM